MIRLHRRANWASRPMMVLGMALETALETALEMPHRPYPLLRANEKRAVLGVVHLVAKVEGVS